MSLEIIYKNQQIAQLTEDGTLTLETAGKYVEGDIQAVYSGGVISFNGRTGAVTPQSGDYTAAMVGLGNVNNTSDVNKPVSAATQTALDAKQNKVQRVTVTLTAEGWENKSQTVTVPGVSATETEQLIQPVPASASRDAYEAAGIRATAQAANSLTFRCKTEPETALSVYVVITEVSA